MASKTPIGLDDDVCTPIAIVGLAFEFPNEATSVESFWRMICEGRSASTEFPPDRLNINAFYHPDDDRPSTIAVRGGHFLAEDLAAFDAPFFSITPGEAECMDPQHRRMLETAYHALEDAGLPLEKCAGSQTSVYTGCFTNDYLSILQQDYDAEQKHAAMGIAPSMLANRLSWFFDFKGASVNLDSACSSSLVALHLACQDLRAGNSSMALVGGSNLVYHPNFLKIMSDFNFLSRDSRCWSFDQRANGYARGEGFAVLVVKRLDDAVRDGDTIRAVIRNIGSNQDGKTPGITQPSQEAQIDLIEKIYRQGGIDMRPTRFFEAHATGTPVGDPIEGNALGRAFRKHRSKDDPLYIGAVKSNIGHLEGCSGLAGIIKAILVLENGVIPPIAGFESLNPQIDANELHLVFPKATVPWPSTEVRRACVNSFGFGGTNAVAILDDAYNYLRLRGLQANHRTRQSLAANGSGDVTGQTNCTLDVRNGPYSLANDKGASCRGTDKPRLLVWSAPDRDGTKRLSTAYQDYLARKKLAGSALDDLVYSLVVKRSNFSWRSFAVVNSPDTHDTAAAVMISNPVRRTTNPNVAFIFTGQGSQYLGMGRRLISLPVFRGSLENCEEYLGDFGCKWSLLEKLSGVSTNPQIDSPGYSQPLVTCLQIALVDLFQSLGVVPSIVIGHSSGEIAAAYASGALSKSSAVKVAYYRGIMSAQLVSFVKDTAMMAVGISRENVEAYLSRLRTLEPIMEVSIGCVNSPQSITLTGDTQQLRTLEAWLNADGVFNRKLRVPIAYHSRFMEAFAVEYSLALNKLDSGRSSGFLPMISSVTKDIVPAAELVSAEYWVRNLTSTVEFEAAFAKLLAYASHKPRNQLGKRLGSQSLSITHILEVGPHTTLQGPIRDNLNLHVGTKPEYIASLVRKQDALVSIQKALGTLFCAGFTVDILAVNTLQDIPRLPPPDMPRYPFNHALTYWRESSLSRNFRFRQNARHELLGTRSLDWNAQIAQWRNIVRISELPWLEDHKIGTNVVFPAAGMIAIAIEAIRQLIGAAAPLCGFHIQHTSFMHAISFSRDQPQVETQLTLSRPSLAKDEQEWSQFRLFVLENRSYMECCSGWIRPVANAKDRDRVMAAWSWCCRDTPRDWIDKVNTACSGAEKDPYDMISGTEVRYGPAFQNLEGMHVGPRGEVKARINTETWKLGNRSLLPPSFAIHPTTLDGLAQPLLQALLAQRPDGLPTMVPIRVSQIWVACPASQLHSERIDVAAKCAFSGHRGGKADIIATAPDATFPLVFMQGLETSFISSNEKFDGVLDKTSRNLCTKLEWKPDVESLTSDQLLSYCTRERPKQLANTVQSHRLLLTTILCFVEDALAYVDQHPEVVPDGHLKAYVAWMQYQQQRLRLGRSLVTDDSVQHLLQSPDARERANREVEESGIDGLFFIQTGRKLLQMLRGELDPLEFMFGEGLADRYYEKMLANDHHAYPASEYIDLLCFKNPSMKILEVGAGTGGQTLRLIEAMSRDGVNKWKQYDYTDISPRFFSGAREKFRGHLDHMAFRVCDISRDPVAQGFEANSYDLVVASHVLHATEDLQQTLSNIHKLLKPNGKLLFFETTLPDAIPVGFSFGLLKGWWAPLEHEERAPHSPCVTTKHWNTLLKLSGFSGVDVDIPGQEEKYCRSSSILISTAESGPSEVTKTSAPILLVVDDRVQTQCVVAKTLQSLMSGSLADRCKTCTMAQLADQDSQNSPLLIFLLELDAILLGNISENDYALLQSALLRFKTILWTTRSDKQTGGEPAHHLVDGLARTLMSEDSARKFVTLSLDSFRQDAERVSKVISEAAQRVLDVQVEDVENHCIATPDGIEICRVAQDVYMDDQVAARVSPCQIQEIQLSTDTQICLRSTPGHLDTLGWQEIAQDRPGRHERLEMDEVVILVQAIGLTFADYLVAKGEITENGLAAECAGVVQEAGSTSGFKPGDQVCLLSNGAACSIVRAKASAVAHIPPQMSFVEAASIPSALWLSYQALFNSANMQEGDTVLTLQGTSCVAQMLIQLARSYGARVLVLTGSTAKSDFIRDKLAIPETDIFNTEDSTMLSKLYEATSGQGVDIIVGPLSETAYTTSDFLSSCLAPLGRIVDTSSHVSRQVDLALPPFAAWQSNVARSCVNMADLLRQRPSLVHKTFQSALKIFCAKSIRLPQPIHCFTANNVQDAFLHFEERNVIGKRVIELNATTTIIAEAQSKPRYNFTQNATYVIGGGLGGLGRSFARWMASRGAKNLILLSRSGAKSEEAKALLRELEAQDVTVAAPAVDMGNLAQLKAALLQLNKSMPPIRGCIQATVALRDNLFQNMTYEDWAVGVGSKATSSWNLHLALPTGLDFFVMLASLNGIIGGRAQANYAAGNTFKDALAHHRISIGEKAVSIDLGLVVSEGIVAENADLLASMRRIGHLMDIRQEQLLSLMDYFCDPGLPVLPHSQAQILVGLETPASVEAKGIDLHHGIYRPMFRQMFRMDAGSSSTTTQGVTTDYTAALTQAKSDDEATELVASWFRAKVAQILGLQEADVDMDRPVHTYGIDSLVSIDLKNWFAREIRAEIQVFVLLGNKSLREVSEEAAQGSLHRQGPRAVKQ